MEKVYFIATEGLRFVKIGFSKDPKKRWAQLQTGNPLNSFVLGILPGGRVCEALLHMQFADLRVSPATEWFELRGQLLAYLEMKGLFHPSYADSTPQVLKEASMIRRCGWDVFSHDDLDRILVEPSAAWQVYYGICEAGVVKPGRRGAPWGVGGREPQS